MPKSTAILPRSEVNWTGLPNTQICKRVCELHGIGRKPIGMGMDHPWSWLHDRVYTQCFVAKITRAWIESSQQRSYSSIGRKRSDFAVISRIQERYLLHAVLVELGVAIFVVINYYNNTNNYYHYVKQIGINKCLRLFWIFAPHILCCAIVLFPFW